MKKKCVVKKSGIIDYETVLMCTSIILKKNFNPCRQEKYNLKFILLISCITLTINDEGFAQVL